MFENNFFQIVLDMSPFFHVFLTKKNIIFFKLLKRKFRNSNNHFSVDFESSSQKLFISFPAGRRKIVRQEATTRKHEAYPGLFITLSFRNCAVFFSSSRKIIYNSQLFISIINDSTIFTSQDFFSGFVLYCYSISWTHTSCN